MNKHVMTPLCEETGVFNFCTEMQVLASVVEVRSVCRSQKPLKIMIGRKSAEWAQRPALMRLRSG